jgi:hypothetical protein
MIPDSLLVILNQGVPSSATEQAIKRYENKRGEHLCQIKILTAGVFTAVKTSLNMCNARIIHSVVKWFGCDHWSAIRKPVCVCVCVHCVMFPFHPLAWGTHFASPHNFLHGHYKRLWIKPHVPCKQNCLFNGGFVHNIDQFQVTQNTWI